MDFNKLKSYKKLIKQCLAQNGKPIKFELTKKEYEEYKKAIGEAHNVDYGKQKLFFRGIEITIL